MATDKASISSFSSSASSAAPSSGSLVRVDELSAFGATKNSRLPALIKLSELADEQRQTVSMPAASADKLEQPARSTPAAGQVSLPAGGASGADDKENKEAEELDTGDYQLVEMSAAGAEPVGPSLPQPTTPGEPRPALAEQLGQPRAAPAKGPQAATAPVLGAAAVSSQLGDSLIDMVVNLRTENQNLVRALETNNEYVKERISKYKRLNEEAQRREQQFAVERADFEHQTRKLQRQNQVLSERLKSMETKLRELRLDVNSSLAAAAQASSSSGAGSAAPSPAQGRAQAGPLYPDLSGHRADAYFRAQQTQPMEAATMQMDNVSGSDEQRSEDDDDDDDDDDADDDADADDGAHAAGASAPMETDQQQASSGAARLAAMDRRELDEHFGAAKRPAAPDNKWAPSSHDYMKQCDQLEKQLNDIGKRDYEICLLQQQLNIYRQDFRLERMANLEAKLQIERLKADIDRLCLDRLQNQRSEEPALRRSSYSRRSGNRLADAADAALGKLGHQLSKRAAKHAARAARHASKMAHREEKAAAAAAAAHVSTSTCGHARPATQTVGGEAPLAGQHSGRRGPHAGLRGLRAVRSEVVSDLMSTANKAMLTGYKMASTHVNLALDKLSQFEQQQAQQLSAQQQEKQQKEHPSAQPTPSAPMQSCGPPSID